MRIAYFLTSFPNTSETFILNEIAEAIQQGMDVRVFSLMQPAGACPHAVARSLMSRVTYLPPAEDVSLFRMLLFHMRALLLYRFQYLSALMFALTHRENAMLWVFKIAAFYAYNIGKFAPQRIHTHFAYGSCRLAMMIAKMMGVPYTFTIHGWYDLYKSPPPDLGIIMREAKKTITVCNFNRNYILDQYKIPEDRIDIIRCGISPAFFEPVSHNAREQGLIVSVGRLHYHKAYHVLISACKILADRNVSFTCRIIGDGELRNELEEQIASLELNTRVRLVGARSNEEVRAILLKAEVFAMSSAVETVGLAVVEALATEVPAVATRVYGVPEMVRNDETGYLCEAGDAECIADRLQKLLLQKDLRKSMGATGRALVMQEHNLPVQVAKLVQVWRS
jgi:colanic acid/amylovoran biosynthesis glycosyltransferase